MFKKFTDGLIFGAGFTLSFIILWYMAAYFIQPTLTERQIEHFKDEYPDVISKVPQPPQLKNEMGSGQNKIPFHEQSIEEQIKQSSVIALSKYESAPDGRTKAVITEFLKKDPDTTIYYNIGDEYPPASYFPKENTSHGDGVVIFFTGSPAMMRMSMTYSGNRIRSLGDLPVSLLREKCK